LKLSAFSHWLNPRAEVMFNGAHDPAGPGLGRIDVTALNDLNRWEVAS
jgi:hypothetical protein